MSDRGIPSSYRHMHGFGSYTFSCIDADNERFWVKFHLQTHQGIKNLTDQEVEALVQKSVRVINKIYTKQYNEATFLNGMSNYK